MARYARPVSMAPDGRFYDGGVQIDTPATRVATGIARDIYMLANQAGVAPLLLAQRITDAFNEGIEFHNQRERECEQPDPMGQALNEGDGVYRP